MTMKSLQSLFIGPCSSGEIPLLEVHLCTLLLYFNPISRVPTIWKGVPPCKGKNLSSFDQPKPGEVFVTILKTSRKKKNINESSVGFMKKEGLLLLGKG